MIFDAFAAMSEPAFLWWAVKVALALAAFCAVVWFGSKIVRHPR